MSSVRTTAARPAVDPVAREAGRSVAALFDLLDRANGGPVSTAPRSRRPATYRPAGARGGAVRTVPLRSVRPAPSARPLLGPSVVRVAPPAPVPAPGRIGAWIRRAAMWGAGSQGQYLAWRPAAAPALPRPAPAVPSAASSPTRRRGLVRRVALWGAGADGKYLAWGGPVRPVVRPLADRPVVLREMPSTPTIPPPLLQPVAPSPAAAQPPRGPASTGPRWMPPVPRGAVAVPGVRPSGPPERSRATGWPRQAHTPGVATGLVRARGDPLSSPARGSPAPARRSVPPGSSWSSFP